MRLSSGLQGSVLPGTGAASGEFLLPTHGDALFPLWLQECDDGYTRSTSGLYLGTCERCNCHGHASSCDPETGSCQVGVDSASFLLLCCFDLCPGIH